MTDSKNAGPLALRVDDVSEDGKWTNVALTSVARFLNINVAGFLVDVPVVYATK